CGFWRERRQIAFKWCVERSDRRRTKAVTSERQRRRSAPSRPRDTQPVGIEQPNQGGEPEYGSSQEGHEEGPPEEGGRQEGHSQEGPPQEAVGLIGLLRKVRGPRPTLCVGRGFLFRGCAVVSRPTRPQG